MYCRSNSNSSIKSNESTSSKKQVTSKIASLWRKVEDTKKQPPKKDTRKWIQPQPETAKKSLVQLKTFELKNDTALRNPPIQNRDASKRISRLGSFVIMDDENTISKQHQSGNTNGVSIPNVI